VLFITSLLASHLFLRSPWRRLVLVAFVIPLGILRNGFRFSSSDCSAVHVGPHMVDSIIHRRGGAVLFRVVADSAVPPPVVAEARERPDRHVGAEASTSSSNDVRL